MPAIALATHTSPSLNASHLSLSGLASLDQKSISIRDLLPGTTEEVTLHTILAFYERYVEDLKNPEWKISERDSLATLCHDLGFSETALRLLAQNAKEIVTVLSAAQSVEEPNPYTIKELQTTRLEHAVSLVEVDHIEAGVSYLRELLKEPHSTEVVASFLSHLTYFLEKAYSNKSKSLLGLLTLARTLDLTALEKTIEAGPYFSERKSVPFTILKLAHFTGDTALASRKFDQIIPTLDPEDRFEQHGNQLGHCLEALTTCGIEPFSPLRGKIVSAIRRFYNPESPGKWYSNRDSENLRAWLVHIKLFDELYQVIKERAATGSKIFFYENRDFLKRLEFEFGKEPTRELAQFVVSLVHLGYKHRPEGCQNGSFATDLDISKWIQSFHQQGFQSEAETLSIYLKDFFSLDQGGNLTKLKVARALRMVGNAPEMAPLLTNAISALQGPNPSDPELSLELATFFDECGSRTQALPFLQLAASSAVELLPSGKWRNKAILRVLPTLKEFSLNFDRLQLIQLIKDPEIQCKNLEELCFEFARSSNDLLPTAVASYEKVFPDLPKGPRYRAAFALGALSLHTRNIAKANHYFRYAHSDPDWMRFRSEDESLLWLQHGYLAKSLALVLEIPDVNDRERALRRCARSLLKDENSNLVQVNCFHSLAERLRPYVTSNSLESRISELSENGNHHTWPVNQSTKTTLTTTALLGPAETVADHRAQIKNLVALGIDNELIKSSCATFHHETLGQMVPFLCVTLNSFEYIENSTPIVQQLYNDAKEILSGTRRVSRATGRYCIQGLAALKSKEANDVLVAATRNILEDVNHPARKHLPVLLLTLCTSSSHASKELLRLTLSREDLPYRIQRTVIYELCKTGFLEKGTAEWLEERKLLRKRIDVSKMASHQREEIEFLRTIFRRGLTPSKEIIDFATSPGPENAAASHRLPEIANARLDALERFKAKFDQCPSLESLLKIFEEDQQNPLYFYLLNNGRTTFSLINNYSIDKFRQIIGDISKLRVVKTPLERFITALPSHLNKTVILDNLIAGHFPISIGGPAEASGTFSTIHDTKAKLAAANNEISAICGPQQLGALLKTDSYRRYLAEKDEPEARELLAKLNNSTNVVGRAEAIKEVEIRYPAVSTYEAAERDARWQAFSSRCVAPLNEILTKKTTPIEALALLEATETQRQSLKHSQEAIISAIKGEDPRHTALMTKLNQKEKVRARLVAALDHNPNLSERIAGIDKQIGEIRGDVAALGQSSISSRFEGLSPQDRHAIIASERQALKAIVEKEAAPVLVSLLLDAVVTTPPTENDITVAKEISSHLASPFQSASDVNRQGDISTQRIRNLRIHYLNKVKDFMSIVRFADSKICCFSSSNYEMRVSADIPNRERVAAIVKDPLSFVFMIEEDSPRIGTAENITTKNLGFCFGMWGLTEKSEPALFLNGIYYAPGSDTNVVDQSLREIETLLATSLGAKLIVLAAQHGGSVPAPPTGYAAGPVKATRLRALSSNSSPHAANETYDDLGTVINSETAFHGWFKPLT